MELAKGDGIAVVLVGHVTKDGSIAGPKTLEHLVDAVLNLEGERSAGLRLAARIEEPLRIDRGGRRLRDGRARPDRGRPIPPGPSSSNTTGPAPGSVVAPTLEGSRPLLVEVQALVAPASYGTPRRTGERTRSQPACPARRGPRPAGRHRPGQPRRVRQPRRRPGRRGARPRPAARPRAGLVAARPAGRARRRSRSARWGCSASCGAVSGLERRLREAARLGFTRAIVPRPAAERLARRSSTASRSCAVGHAPRGRRSRPWSAGRRGERSGDARLTPAPRAPAVPAVDRRGSAPSTVIRNIRILGAALGGIVGLALATSLGGGLVRGGPDYAGALPGRLGRGLDRRRLRRPAVPDDRPGAAGSSGASRSSRPRSS